MESAADSHADKEFRLLEEISKFVDWLQHNKDAIIAQAALNLGSVPPGIVKKRVDIHYGRIFNNRPFPCGTTLEMLAKVASAIPGAPVPSADGIAKLHRLHL